MWKFVTYKGHFVRDIGGSGGTVADWQMDGGELVHCFTDPTAVPCNVVATTIKPRAAEVLHRATNPVPEQYRVYISCTRWNQRLKDLRNVLYSVVFVSPCSGTSVQNKTAFSGIYISAITGPTGADFILSLTQKNADDLHSLGRVP